MNWLSALRVSVGPGIGGMSRTKERGFRPRTACALAGGIGLLVLLVCPVLPKAWAAPCAVVLALVAAPIGCVVCLRNVLSPRGMVISSAALVVSASVYAFSWLIPAPPEIGVAVWVGAGFIAALTVILLQGGSSFRPVGLHRGLLIGGGLVWWGCWGIGTIAATGSQAGCVLGPELRCTGNLKIIGIARLRFEEIKGAPPPSVATIVESGLLSEEEAKCPLGTAYTDVNASPAGARPDDTYVLLCPNHPPNLLLLARSSAVSKFEKLDRSRRKFAFRPDN